MIPTNFPSANTHMKAPPDFDVSQVMTIPAYSGQVNNPSSSVDGAPIVVVAWKPEAHDLAILKHGGVIYLSCIGGLPPHFLSTDFQAATNPL